MDGNDLTALLSVLGPCIDIAERCTVVDAVGGSHVQIVVIAPIGERTSDIPNTRQLAYPVQEDICVARKSGDLHITSFGHP